MAYPTETHRLWDSETTERIRLPDFEQSEAKPLEERPRDEERARLAARLERLRAKW